MDAPTAAREIIARAPGMPFDIAGILAPDDPLRDRLLEWRPYYRVKAAVAAVLTPRSICEIGVRYGYCATAFLSEAGPCTYLGLDNDSATYGGVRGAITYARALLASWPSARVECVDTQTLDDLPADYDLIHVDGQQDEAGSAHDLALAMRRGCWVLVDGYGYSGQVKRAVDSRLRSNGIQSVAFIDDYAVEVLIQPTRGIA